MMQKNEAASCISWGKKNWTVIHLDSNWALNTPTASASFPLPLQGFDCLCTESALIQHGCTTLDQTAAKNSKACRSDMRNYGKPHWGPQPTCPPHPAQELLQDQKGACAQLYAVSSDP